MDGRLAVITGTGGLGLQTALQLARTRCEVVLAGRNEVKGLAAVRYIQEQHPLAKVRFRELDLAKLRSVAEFAESLRQETDRLDVLVNNAAVMTPPKREKTADGFELQFGTNFLAHFALTRQLLPLLEASKSARVVTVSSIAARSGVINFDDLQSERRYIPMMAYSQSKLAGLLFTQELQRRSSEAGWGIDSVAAHPGISRTDLLYKGAGRNSRQGIARTLLWFLFQPVWQGALPILFAATASEVLGGRYYGPARMAETRGHPVEVPSPEAARDAYTAQRLWEACEGMVQPIIGLPPPVGIRNQADIR